MRKFKLRILDCSKDDLILERRYDSVSGLFAALLIISRFLKSLGLLLILVSDFILIDDYYVAKNYSYINKEARSYTRGYFKDVYRNSVTILSDVSFDYSLIEKAFTVLYTGCLIEFQFSI